MQKISGLYYQLLNNAVSGLQKMVSIFYAFFKIVIKNTFPPHRIEISSMFLTHSQFLR